MAYEDFKDLARRTASDNILRDKAFNIAKNPKYQEYQRRLASIVYLYQGVVQITITMRLNKI